MKRRIIIVSATFSILLAAFLLYYFTSSYGVSKRALFGYRPHPGTTGKPTTLPNIGEVYPAKGIKIYQYEKPHRLRAVYLASHSERVGNKVLLTNPQIHWYLKGGQEVTLRADRGTIVVESVGDKGKIRRGELIGNVCVVMDRGTAPDRPPIEERPEDIIRVEVEQASFDNDLLTIESSSRVKVFSKEADIFGKGLRISWSESPSRLNELKILQGESMHIRAVQNQFISGIALPGGGEEIKSMQAGQLQPASLPTGTTSTKPTFYRNEIHPAGSFSTTTYPATSPAGDSTTTTTTQPKTAHIVDKTPSSIPSSMPTTRATSQPATSPAKTKEPTPLPIVPDTYVATLTGDIHIRSGTQQVKGARKLTLIFHFTPPKQEQEKSRDRTPPATTEANKASVLPAKKPTTTTIAATKKASPTTLSTQTSPTTASSKTLIITWTGPLILRPLRGYDKVIPNRFDVSIIGEELTLSDGKATAICKKFNFYSTRHITELIGEFSEPVKLQTSSGIEISAIRVNFNSATGLAELIGAGSMKLPATQSLQMAGVSTKPSKENQVHITWSDGVQAAFGQRKITKDGKVIATEDFLREANFFGNVNLTQGKERTMQAQQLQVRFYPPIAPGEPINRISHIHAAGDVQLNDAQSDNFIQAEQLDIQMSALSDESAYPKEALARGNISAKQGKTYIKANKSLNITFVQIKNEKTNKTEIKPQKLTAIGAVEIIDRSGEQPTIAIAETINSNLLDKTAVLKGSPAKIIQKDKQGKENFIEGDDIFLDGLQESASITGKGRLKFYSDTDISGKKTDTPKSVQISWTKKMTYRGKERTAIAVGDVHLTTSEDELRCQNLYILFATKETQADKTLPMKAQKTPGIASATLTSPIYTKIRRISLVIAKGNARLRSYRKDEKGFLLQRVQLRSEHILYQADKAILTCSGPGTLVAEDYRKPIPTDNKKSPDNNLLAGRIDRPSQSAFSWSKSMVLDWPGPEEQQNQGRNTIITMIGDVHMAHRSGRQIVLSEKLNIHKWKLPPGRNIMLRCDRILVQFAAPERHTRKQEGTAEGITIGPVELFDARGQNVHLRDGPREVFCQRILYQRQNDVAIIWGSLPGNPEKDAILYYQDEKKGTLNTWKSPKIIWFRKTNRIVTKGVESYGGW